MRVPGSNPTAPTFLGVKMAIFGHIWTQNGVLELLGALESVFLTQKPSPSNFRQFMTWIAVRQQDWPSKGTFRGFQSP